MTVLREDFRSRLRTIVSRTRELFMRKTLANDFEREMQFHLDAEIAHNMSKGMSAREARRQAMIAFGGVTQFREQTRAARGYVSLDTLIRDLRVALRRLRRAPALTVGIVATLAIALAAAASIGTIVHGVVLRPLSYPEPDRLVQLSVHTPGIDVTTAEHSAGTFVYLSESARSYASLGWYSFNDGITITEGTPELVVGANVSTNLLHLLGATASAGRLFVEGDANPDSDGKGVLISHELWQRRFNADPDVAGKTIEVNRRRRLILGVVAPLTETPWPQVSVFYPEVVATSSAGLNSRYLTVVGRLAPVATIEQAQRELDVLSSRLHERFPQLSASVVRQMGFRMTVQSLHDAVIAPVYAELRLLALMVGALVLIAVANVSTLSLLRAERLRGEIAVSRALGANRMFVLRRFVMEGALLALGSTLLAFPLASFALTVRFGFADMTIPRLQDISLTPVVAGAIIVLALGIGVLLGYVSAVRADSGSTADALREYGRTTRGQKWGRVQSTLVTVQVGLALALLVGAGLMGASFLRMQQLDLGFESTDRTTFKVRLPFNGYGSWPAVAGFHAQVEETLRQTPGITGAATVMLLPSTPELLGMNPRLDVTRRNGEVAQSFVTLNAVSPSYFDVLSIPLHSGRGFEPNDLVGATPNVIISASLAKALFGEEDPVGREVRLASNGRFPPYRVVGVSGDVYDDRIANGPQQTLYLPLVPRIADSLPMPIVPAGVNYVVRSAHSASQLAPVFRRVVALLDPRVPVWWTHSIDSIVDGTRARARLTMTLFGIASVATLFLSFVGLYSVIAYAVAARRHEFAVRVALGASPSSMQKLVLRQGLVLATCGIALGLVLSIASTRLVRNVLFEVSATDMRLYAAGVLVVLVATLAAILVPAKRAAASDPIGALRSE